MKKAILVYFFLLVFINSTISQVRIKMYNENGVYTTPCIVNGLKLRFIFDTGASNVSLSLSEAIFMLKNGYLEESDLQGSSFSQLANGDIIENTTVNLKEIEIGGIKINNIKATILHELTAPLLFGQSAIQKLGRIQIESDELIILESQVSIINNQSEPASILLKQAEKYYDNDLYALAASTYKSVWDISPNEFSCFDMYNMACSFYFNSNYEMAIKYLKKVEECKPDNKNDYFIASYLGSCYTNIDNYAEAEIYLEKALDVADDDEGKSLIYKKIGHIHSYRNNHNRAVEFFTKSIDFYANSRNIDVRGLIFDKVEDEMLGDLFYYIANEYLSLKQITNADRFMVVARNFGNRPALDYCRTYNVNFEFNKRE